MAKHWVIPDIHGFSKTLAGLIEMQIKPSRNDVLYFLGDYIDRGPDSKGVIDFIMSLQKDEYTIRTLRGNHEDYCIQAFDEEMNSRHFMGIRARIAIRSAWKNLGGRQTLESFGIKNLKDIPGEYIDWMRGLDYYLELDKFILVHAGFNFENEDPFEDRYAMLWTRDFAPQPDKLGGRRIIHGHVPIDLETIYHLKNSRSYDYIDLDNGIYINGREGFGNLVALELGGMELVVQYNLDM